MRGLLLRLLASAPAAGDHVPDAELLRRFAAAGDPAAVELVVRRHADAVWAAAFRVLRNEADAEDAFQAAFLALLRRSKQVRSASVGGWLHRVAVHAALKLKARRTRSVGAGVRLPIHPGPDEGPRAAGEGSPEQAELAAIVHEELARLPERDRLPVVLCDLEGMSHAEVAKALGWPVGTVSGRLSRARAKLRDRLARRGLTPAGVLIPALAIPPQLIPKALSLTAGAPPAVVTLAEGVLAMNAMASWKWVAATALCAGVLGAGGAFAVGLGGGGAEPPAVGKAPAPRQPGEPVPLAEKPAPKEDTPAKSEWLPGPLSDPRALMSTSTKVPPSAFPDLAIPIPAPNDPDYKKKIQERIEAACPRLMGKTEITIAPTDDVFRKLLKARLHRGVAEMIRYREIIRIGSWNASQLPLLLDCLTDLREAAVELWAGQPKELVPWLGELVMMGKEFERMIRIRVELGTSPPQEHDAAIRHRLAAEAALWKAKRAA